MIRWTPVLALLALASCGRERSSAPRPEVPPPDLTGGATGGAASLSAAGAFAYVPREAAAIGVFDPTHILGEPAWLARSPALARAAATLRTGGFDPTRNRIYFFALPGAAAATTVIVEGRLSGSAGARADRVGEVPVQRFDGPEVGIAWGKGVTLVGREPAFSRALEAGARTDHRLSSTTAFSRWRDLFERLPASALFRFGALASPSLLALVERVLPSVKRPALQGLLSTLRETEALGGAVYGHGPAIRFALVLRMTGDEAARRAAASARRAAADLRPRSGERARDPAGALIGAALAALEVRDRGGYLFLESAIPANQVVRVLER
jgi:hypothetical protein